MFVMLINIYTSCWPFGNIANTCYGDISSVICLYGWHSPPSKWGHQSCDLFLSILYCLRTLSLSGIFSAGNHSSWSAPRLLYLTRNSSMSWLFSLALLCCRTLRTIFSVSFSKGIITSVILGMFFLSSKHHDCMDRSGRRDQTKRFRSFLKPFLIRLRIILHLNGPSSPSWVPAFVLGMKERRTHSSPVKH